MSDTKVGAPSQQPEQASASAEGKREAKAVNAATASQYANPPLDDFWAQQVAEKAKARVLGYFGLATVLVAVVSFLYGKEVIDQAVEKEVKSAVHSRSSVIDQQIQGLMQPEREKIARLEEQVIDLNKLLKKDQQGVQSGYSSFMALTGSSTQQIARLLASLKDRPPVAPVVQSTVDLSPLIGPIIDSGDSNAGEGAAALYAIEAMMSKTARKPTLSVAGAFYGSGGTDFGITAEQLLRYLQTVGAYRLSDWPAGSRSRPTSATPIVNITGWGSLVNPDLQNIVGNLRDQRVVIAEMQCVFRTIVTADSGRT